MPRGGAGSLARVNLNVNVHRVRLHLQSPSAFATTLVATTTQAQAQAKTTHSRVAPLHHHLAPRRRVRRAGYLGAKGMVTNASSKSSGCDDDSAAEASPAAAASVAASWSRRDLQHTSALVIVPPPRMWRPIQEIRAEMDKSYLRWMPHVNLLYPFLRDVHFDAAAEIATAALADVSPFRCSLASFAYFKHARSCTVWLHPTDSLANLDLASCSDLPVPVPVPVPTVAAKVEEASSSGGGSGGGGGRMGRSGSSSRAPGAPAKPRACPGIMKVQATLQAAFPFADDLSTISPAGFIPHLSVGQWPDQNAATEAVETLEKAWWGLGECNKEGSRPTGGIQQSRERGALEFTVDAVYLISRKGADAPFEFRARIPLGGGGKVNKAGEEEEDGGGVDVDVDEGEEEEEEEGEWWKRTYAPHPPPEGAKCLEPKSSRRGRRGSRWRGGGGGGGQRRGRGGGVDEGGRGTEAS